MVRELRDLWFVVYRCSAAIEMPDVIRARDELIRRFVSTALSEPEVAAAPTPDCWTSLDDDDELPVVLRSISRCRSAQLDEAVGDVA